MTRPTRDVDVTYRMTPPGPGAALQQRVRWDVADQTQRIDPPTPGVYMLVDYRTRRMTMVRDPGRQAMVLDAGSAGLPGEAAEGAYVRQDDDRVAGLPCTNWTTRDNSGRPATLCFTRDGVMLRARSGPDVLVEAVSVAYGPQDPQAFRVPATYQIVAPPHGE